MINIFGSGADEHIELYMWLRAFTAQAQRRNYQGRSTTELIAHRAGLPGCETCSSTKGEGTPVPNFSRSGGTMR
jgi:hypothetical protein